MALRNVKHIFIALKENNVIIYYSGNFKIFKKDKGIHIYLWKM